MCIKHEVPSRTEISFSGCSSGSLIPCPADHPLVRCQCPPVSWTLASSLWFCKLEICRYPEPRTQNRTWVCRLTQQDACPAVQPSPPGAVVCRL